MKGFKRGIVGMQSTVRSHSKQRHASEGDGGGGSAVCHTCSPVPPRVLKHGKGHGALDRVGRNYSGHELIHKNAFFKVASRCARPTCRSVLAVVTTVS